MLALTQFQYIHALLPLSQTFDLFHSVDPPTQPRKLHGFLTFSQDFLDPLNHFLVPNESFSYISQKHNQG